MLRITTCKLPYVWLTLRARARMLRFNFDRIDQEASSINNQDTGCSEESHTIRSVFFIDNTDEKIIKAILSYPTSVGRSIPEIIRVVDALRTVKQHGVLTPCNWKAVSHQLC